YYAVYRFDGRGTGSVQDPSHLLGTLRKTADKMQFFVDHTVAEGQTYTYVVTAVDRLHNESAPSKPVTVKVKHSGKPGKPPVNPPGKPSRP
ncbi:hypothetical protein GNF82_20805, partial [Clostridium perfringens]